MKKTAAYRAILFLLVLCACNAKEQFVAPDYPEPEKFNNTTSIDSSTFADLEWWELFNDSTLVALIEEGLANNIYLQNTASAIRQSQLQYEISRTFLYPEVNYAATGNLGANTATSGVDGNIIPAANVSYTLDFWGRLRNQRDAAFQAYLASEIAYHQVRASLIAQIATLYFTLRDIDNKIIVAENMIVNMTEFRDVISARYDGGFVSKVDVNQADIRLQGAEFTLQSLTRGRNQLENAISVILGAVPREIPRGLPLEQQVLPDDLPPGVPVYLLQRRPDVAINERKLKAQLRTIDATQALRYPNLTLSFNLGAQLFDPALVFGELAAGLVGPLFNAGRIERSIQIEEEQYEILLNEYLQSYLVALQEVEDALIGIDSYRKEFDIRKEQLLLSQEALDLAWVRYNEGVTPLLDFLNLQSSLFNAQLQASESYKLHLESIVKLYLALGGGWEFEQYTETE